MFIISNSSSREASTLLEVLGMCFTSYSIYFERTQLFPLPYRINIPLYGIVLHSSTILVKAVSDQRGDNLICKLVTNISTRPELHLG